MNIIRRLFGENVSNARPKNVENFKTFEKTEPSNFNDFLYQNAGFSYEKQLYLEEKVKGLAWQFDMQKGEIYFGNHISFPVQILGSFDYNSNTFMWAWANRKSNIPNNLIANALKLKMIGEEKNIEEFSIGHFEIDTNQISHKIGLIASGLLQTSCYYAANYGNGELLLTIDSDEIKRANFDEVEKILTVFPQLISNIELNHFETLKNYLIDREFDLEIEDSVIQAHRNGKIIEAIFDEEKRFLNLKGKL